MFSLYAVAEVTSASIPSIGFADRCVNNSHLLSTQIVFVMPITVRFLTINFDSDCDPGLFTYVVPGNDDSDSVLKYYLKVLMLLGLIPSDSVYFQH